MHCVNLYVLHVIVYSYDYLDVLCNASKCMYNKCIIRVGAYLIHVDADCWLRAKSYAIHNVVYIVYKCIHHTCRICNISAYTIRVCREYICVYITCTCICNTCKCLCSHVIAC